MSDSTIYQIIEGIKNDQPDNIKNKDEEAFHESPIVFYCKDCQAIVEASEIKKGKKTLLSCNTCKQNNVAQGTERSIKNHYSCEIREHSEE